MAAQQLLSFLKRKLILSLPTFNFFKFIHFDDIFRSDDKKRLNRVPLLSQILYPILAKTKNKQKIFANQNKIILIPTPTVLNLPSTSSSDI